LEIDMGEQDRSDRDEFHNPSELEVAQLDVAADVPLHAIRLTAVDPAGAGVAFLLGPQQSTDLVLHLLRALGDLARAFES
jgi:hypothetical protein